MFYETLNDFEMNKHQNNQEYINYQQNCYQYDAIYQSGCDNFTTILNEKRSNLFGWHNFAATPKNRKILYFYFIFFK